MGSSFDSQSQCRMFETFSDEPDEDTDKEQRSEKVDKGEEGKRTGDHVPGLPKRRRPAGGNGNGDPGPSLRKKAWLQVQGVPRPGCSTGICPLRGSGVCAA